MKTALHFELSAEGEVTSIVPFDGREDFFAILPYPNRVRDVECVEQAMG
jgi:hypothetical protein